MKVVIVTGISGIEKEAFIQNFIDRAGIQDVSRTIKFEDELVNPKRRGSGTHPPTKITSFLDERSISNKIRTIEETFTWITAMRIKPEIEYLFLDIHLIYYKNSEYFPPLNPSSFSEWINSLGSDIDIVIINLIDDVFSVWKAILDKEKKFPNTRLTLREILAWRSLETLQSESLPNMLNSPNEGKERTWSFMTSVRHPFSTFKNLILQKTPLCIYLSYPITKTRDDEDRIALVNDFRKRMHGLGERHGFAIFDPVSIDELVLDNTQPEEDHKVLDTKLRWPLDYSDILVPDIDRRIEIPTREIEDSIGPIKHQIKSRDLKLVEYANILAVYRPYYGGLSKGAQAEINHATYLGNEVWIYSPPEDKMPGSGNPFDDDSITIITDIGEYFKKIEESMVDFKAKTLKQEKRQIP